MAGITLKQADGSTVLPKDDAILYDMIVNQSGYIYGCDLTWLGGNQIHITAGYGIIKGRVFEIEEQTIYATLPSVSGKTYYGYLVIAVDLEQSTDPIRIITYCTTDEWSIANGDFEQDATFNYSNGIWELLAAEYTATNTAIANFNVVWEKVQGVYQTLKSFSEWAALNENGYLVDALLQKKQILSFNNIKVAVSSWLANDTYSDYPYRATISCNGVDSNYNPLIAFSLTDATSGTFAPVASTVTGGVCIYANAIPSADITIPTIQCIRKVG